MWFYFYLTNNNYPPRIFKYDKEKKKKHLQTNLLYAQSTGFSSELSKHWGVLSQIWFEATHTGSFGHSNINSDRSQVGSVAKNDKLQKKLAATEKWTKYLNSVINLFKVTT